MKNVHFFVAVFFLSLLIASGCSSSTEVNGGLGNYRPGEETGFSTIFAGAYGTGIFYSNDTGNTWRSPSQNASRGVYCVAASPHYVFCATIQSGLFRSSDNGETWSRVVGIDDSTVYCVYTTGSTVLAGCGVRGIMTSSDEGETWTVSGAFAPGVMSFSALDDILFATGSNGSGIVRSEDHGMNWERLNTNFNATAISAIDGILYATTSGMGLRSTDQGATWQNFGSSFLPAYSIVASKHVLYGGSTNGLLRSIDSGASWQQVSG